MDPGTGPDALSPSIEEQLESAERALSREDEAAALHLSEQVLSRDPFSYPALRVRQEARIGLGEREQVLEEALRAVALKPRDPLACVLLARLLTEQDRDLAGRLLERALLADPRHPFALHGLGVMAAREGRFEEAEARFSQALESAPGFQRARLHRALVRDQLADFEGAADDYTRYLRDDGDDRVALYNLASITHRELHRPDQAEELYRVLLDIDDGLTEAVVGLAVCLTEQHRFEAAEALYLSVRDREPSALFNLGMLYQEHLGRPEQARECFEEFVSLGGEALARQSLADRWIYAPVRLAELDQVLEEKRLRSEARR